MENYRTDKHGVQRKLSIGLRIDSVSPSHVHFALFSAMVLVEYSHDQVTRGKSGDLCLSVDEFSVFADRLKPHIIITFREKELVGKLKEYVGIDWEEYNES